MVLEPPSRYDGYLMRIIGIDPALVHTGWGVIDAEGSKLRFIAAGVISPDKSNDLSQRLLDLSNQLKAVIEQFSPQQAAIEQTFVSINGASTLKLGNARGALLLTLAQSGLQVCEYDATLVKKTITGAGRAEKGQVASMIKILLPQSAEMVANKSSDAFDALAIAITHHHHKKYV